MIDRNDDGGAVPSSRRSPIAFAEPVPAAPISTAFDPGRAAFLVSTASDELSRLAEQARLSLHSVKPLLADEIVYLSADPADIPRVVTEGLGFVQHLRDALDPARTLLTETAPKLEAATSRLEQSRRDGVAALENLASLGAVVQEQQNQLEMDLVDCRQACDRLRRALGRLGDVLVVLEQAADRRAQAGAVVLIRTEATRAAQTLALLRKEAEGLRTPSADLKIVLTAVQAREAQRGKPLPVPVLAWEPAKLQLRGPDLLTPPTLKEV